MCLAKDVGLLKVLSYYFINIQYETNTVGIYLQYKEILISVCGIFLWGETILGLYETTSLDYLK